MTRRQRANRLSVTAVITAAWMVCLGCSSGKIFTYSDHLFLDTSETCCRDGEKTIEILQDPPDRPHVKVAYVEAFAAFYADSQVTWEMLRSQLCRQAIEVKADAIIQLKVGGEAYSRTVEVLDVEVGSGGETKKLSGFAIRYK